MTTSRPSCSLRRLAPPDKHTFGGRKVFIHHVYEAARSMHPEIHRMSLDTFKRRLVEVMRRRSSRLELARADLVSAMKPDDVSASHTDGGGATYNFVVRR